MRWSSRRSPLTLSQPFSSVWWNRSRTPCPSWYACKVFSHFVRRISIILLMWSLVCHPIVSVLNHAFVRKTSTHTILVHFVLYARYPVIFEWAIFWAGLTCCLGSARKRWRNRPRFHCIAPPRKKISNRLSFSYNNGVAIDLFIFYILHFANCKRVRHGVIFSRTSLLSFDIFFSAAPGHLQPFPAVCRQVSVVSGRFRWFICMWR